MTSHYQQVMTTPTLESKMKHTVIARPGQALKEHLVNVGALTSEFSDAFGLPLSGKLLGLGHDEGKVSMAFQHYIRNATGVLDITDEHYVDATGLRGTIDHSTAAAQKLWQAHGEGTSTPLEQLCVQMLAVCLFSHHSGLSDCFSLDGTYSFGKRISKDEGKTHLKEVLRVFGPGFGGDGALATRTLAEMRQVLLPIVKTPRSTICGACSNCRIPNPTGWFAIGQITRILLSCLLDADRIDSADAETPANRALRADKPDWPVFLQQLDAKITSMKNDRSIDVLRRQISDACLARAQDPRGIFTLTVPTGGGKTLSGLRFALAHAARHNMARVINVIPYTSIIDQNAEVARVILEKGREPGSVVLEHHSNLDPDKDTLRGRLAAENWDAPVIFTTMVQFLEALFAHGTRSTRRMHRMANAVIVFDEIQTLPINCARLFVNAVNVLVAHCGATVVLCTATQPLLHRLPDPALGVLMLSPEQEIMPNVEALFDSLRRVEIVDRTRPSGWSVEQVANLAREKRTRTNSCLVVVNTKDWAMRIYQALAAAGEEGLHHLSTDMCPAHRMDVLKAVHTRLNKKQREICISTQLIEAGVDISFGSVIRLLAGMDSILQAAGRCNRNGESSCGIVSVVNADQEYLDSLQSIKVGQDCSALVLREFRDDPVSLGGTLTHPSVVERYFKYSFFERRREMDYPVRDSESGVTDTLFNLLSCNPKLPVAGGNVLRLRQSFATAGRLFKVIDAPTQGIIVPYGEGKKLIIDLCSSLHPIEQGQLLRRAQRYSVNVFPHTFEKLQEVKAVFETQPGSGIFHLDQQYYSKEFGISTTPVEEMETLFA